MSTKLQWQLGQPLPCSIGTSGDGRQKEMALSGIEPESCRSAARRLQSVALPTELKSRRCGGMPYKTYISTWVQRSIALSALCRDQEGEGEDQ
ncbi:hypothetical protein AAT19DRAFT_8850 [Rhodotorula toruloides]|uniref:Uncharacterized protein n=1 Tax=Rhodotorula toruloides TaxID=5286 RepID=A0A2T0AIG3_RHOTO|nr:hypothetical protein AAT19DRAFT_8850 [Rhodotorula toruloides]